MFDRAVICGAPTANGGRSSRVHGDPIVMGVLEDYIFPLIRESNRMRPHTVDVWCAFVTLPTCSVNPKMEQLVVNKLRMAGRLNI